MTEREQMEVDVLVVGAGPAGLAAAWSLAKKLGDKAGEHQIMVIEKGRAVGDHILSGAVMDPRAMAEVFGDDWRAQGCPVEADVVAEKVLTLTATKAKPLPFIPPPLANHGNVIVALSNVVRWMKEKVESLGVMVAEGYGGDQLLIEGNRVAGVRLIDQGRNPDGSEGSSFAPGAEIRAKVTVLAEGTRGSLTKALVDRMKLAGPNPQIYGTGVKELWEVPAGRLAKGTVIHSAGWPLPDSCYGGSWIYAQSDTRLSIGFVTALDGGPPGLDPYEMMQTWKTHPFVRPILEGGSVIKGGAKTVPEGGWWSRPKSYGDGFLILGDAGSLLNIARLKGIHAALKSGQLAGETIAEALGRGDLSEAALAAYENRLQTSWIRDELWRVRNWRQAFAKGFRLGKIHAGLLWLFGGRLFKDPLPIHADFAAMERGQASAGRTFKPDRALTFDKLTGVYQAGSTHEEHQPSHLKVADTNICATRCAAEYGNPCERFCPAAVYEMVDASGGGRRLQINYSNCVHCKTCDILDPYEIITWTVPQDAGGPRYMTL
jgi:electron-transferring-flavoprotein dehydrogenase